MTDLTANTYEVALDAYTMGFRWTDIQIPRLAVIGEALFKPWVWFDGGDPDLIIQAQVSDNPPTFTAANGNILNRPRTIAQVIWNEDNLDNGRHDSPDLKTVIQEIINRPGWRAGNALVLIVRPRSNSSVTFASIDQGPQGGADIDIEWHYAPLNVGGEMKPSGAIHKSQSMHLEGEMAPEGSLSFKRRMTLGGEMQPDGVVTFNQKLHLGGEMRPSGSLTLAQSGPTGGGMIELEGNMEPFGDVTFNQKLALGGEMRPSGSLTIVFKEGPEPEALDKVTRGNTITLRARYRKGDGTVPMLIEDPELVILDPEDNEMARVTPFVSPSGRAFYDYLVPSDVPIYIWRTMWSALIEGEVSPPRFGMFEVEP